MPVSTGPARSVGMNAHAAMGPRDGDAGFDMGTNGSGVSTSMHAPPFVDARGVLGNGSLPDMHAMTQPAAKCPKVGSNMLLPTGTLTLSTAHTYSCTSGHSLRSLEGSLIL